MSLQGREYPHACPLCDEGLYLREEQLGAETSCPHCAEVFTAQADAVVLGPKDRRRLGLDAGDAVRIAGDDPGVYPCPRCDGEMELFAFHEGTQVACPHCGGRSVPRSGDVVPAPVAPSSSLGPQAVGRLAAYLGAAGLFGSLAAPLFCGFGVLALCGPIGLFLVSGHHGELRRRGRKDREIERGYWMCFLALTALIACALVVSASHPLRWSVL